VKRLIGGEKGQALVLALIILALGGLIIGPLLAYINTGLTAGGVYERKAGELYAADAGVEDAIWKIQNNIGLCEGSPTTTYNISDVNGKSVGVTITYVSNASETITYKITSIATTSGSSHTKIEAYVGANVLSGGFLKNAITSNGSVTISPNCEVNGNVTYGTSISGNGSVNGTARQGYLTWPSCSDLSDFYLANVTGAPDPGSTIDVGTQTVPKGPCYRREGDKNLHIRGKGGTLKLTGTIYVTGNLYCDQSGRGYTIDLNGQTIFALGTIEFPAQHVTVTGSGCIIACGNINFQPGIMSSPGDFVFVMSATGQVNFQPSGNFYGSVAGDVNVNLQPGNALTWHSLGGTSLNVPASISSETQTVTGATIRSWTVSQQ